MEEIKINEKFKTLLPALSEEEFLQLEESILSEGVRESIKVWKNQIVDGHNRFEICEKHDLPFAVMDLHFADESEAVEWIFINQLGRRNLNPNQRTLFIGQLYELRKKKVGAPEENNNAEKQFRQNDGIVFQQNEDLQNSETIQPDPVTPEEISAAENLAAAESEFSEDLKRLAEAEAETTTAAELTYELDAEFQPRKPKLSLKNTNETAKQIAKEQGISPRTVERAAQVAQAIENKPELKDEFLAGKLSQKQVIEKAKDDGLNQLADKLETDVKKEFPAETDDFTETAARHARKLHTLVKDLQIAITAANNDFAKHGQDFDNFGNIRRLSLNPLEEMEWKTRLLKTLKKCAKCKGEKCAKCKQTGYQDKSAYSTTKSAMS